MLESKLKEIENMKFNNSQFNDQQNCKYQTFAYTPIIQPHHKPNHNVNQYPKKGYQKLKDSNIFESLSTTPMPNIITPKLRILGEKSKFETKSKISNLYNSKQKYHGQ